MFQYLTTGFPQKLARDALAAHLSADLIADLYPTGSWRDHVPGQPSPTSPRPSPSSTTSRSTSRNRASNGRVPIHFAHDAEWVGFSHYNVPIRPSTLNQTLALFQSPCSTCVAGSNAWAVSGSRTASGKPLLSNDMHLALAVPELWYEADLQATNPAPQPAFHVAGVTLPGTPFVIAGHNDHVAWGFTNLGADVQDLVIEHSRHLFRRRVPGRQRRMAPRPLPDRGHPGARQRRRHPRRPPHPTRRHRHAHRLQRLSHGTPLP